MTTFNSLMLVFVTGAIGLGLASVAAAVGSLGVDDTSPAALFISGPDPELASSPAVAVLSTVQPFAPTTPFDPIAQGGDCSYGDCKSPLYPQNGVTMWDRIRVSSQHDPRSFLMGAGIQVHAPATAATPWPDQTRQYRCFSDKLCGSSELDTINRSETGD